LYAAAVLNGLVGDDGDPVLGHDPQWAQRRPAGTNRSRRRFQQIGCDI
jgi:hypothetical protein